MPGLIDSHCHPDGEEFAADAAAVLQRAAGAGLAGLVAIGGGAEPAALDRALEWVRLHRPAAPLRLWATVGIHPHDAARAVEDSWPRLRALTGDPLVIAIGEIGLDYFYHHSPRATQLEVFERQLALAAECGLPASLHIRDAWDDCFRMLEAHNPAARGVFHCFTGGREEARRALDLGWCLSFSGMLTFAKADVLREVAAWAPADRLLVETDAPFLAPVPHRGRRNEPAFVASTAARLAELRGVTLEQVAELTSANFFRLFPRAAAA